MVIVIDDGDVFSSNLRPAVIPVAMKTNPSLEIFKPAKATALAIVIAWGVSVQAAKAVPYVVTLQQVGSNVVATGSGAVDVSGLNHLLGSDFGGSTIVPNEAFIVTGSTGFFDDYFSPAITGPTSFGSGGGFPAFSGTGDHVGIDETTQILFLPQNYVSGDPLTSSATWSFQTLASLGVTPGTYKWTWGTGADQSFTLDVVATAPDTGSTLGLLSLSLIALFGASRLRSLRSA
jgi:hypothetical protein